MPDYRPILVPASDEVPPWPCQPFMSGRWREVPTPLVDALRSQSARFEAQGAQPLADPILRMRTLPLSFYPGWLLVEGLAQYSPDAHGVFRLLLGPENYRLLDGQSAAIHRMNHKHLDLSGGPAVVDQYLRFFTSAVRGEEGPFRVVESVAEIESGDGIEPAERDRAASLIRPLKRHRSPGSPFIRSANLLYGRNLFGAKFRVGDTGMVEMIEDYPIISDFLAGAPFYDGIWHIIPIRPNPMPKPSRSRGR